ncbi:hypothetical protein SCA6_000641 [Theobroma cacao]
MDFGLVGQAAIVAGKWACEYPKSKEIEPDKAWEASNLFAINKSNEKKVGRWTVAFYSKVIGLHRGRWGPRRLVLGIDVIGTDGVAVVYGARYLKQCCFFVGYGRLLLLGWP